jgi:hypothetical protein
LPNSFKVDQAYTQSKLFQILAMKEMRRRLGPESDIKVIHITGPVDASCIQSLCMVGYYGIHTYR